MPSIILAPIKITGVTGQATFGDVLQITPKSNTKSYNGSGSGVTGDFSGTFTLINVTNTADPDVVDNNNTANN